MADPVKQPPKSTDSAEELTFIGALKGLLKKHDDAPMEARPGGERRKRAIDDAVDEAVTGAPKKPEDF